MRPKKHSSGLPRSAGGWLLLMAFWLFVSACPSPQTGLCKEDKDCTQTGQSCVAGTCACKAPLLGCGQECVDVKRNRIHCGACGKACPDGELCLSGACSKGCTAPQIECKGACILTDGDPQNCGACGKACASGEECKNGACLKGCPPGQVSCDGLCIDTLANGLHCGACGNACASGQVCSGGSCLASCPAATPQVCLGGCVDLDRNGLHCGACGKACQNGQICSQGQCSCAASTTVCSGQCADLQSDRAHCGSCGNACGGGQLCASGGCVASCPASTPTVCFGGCIDTAQNVLHCGKCGQACAVDERCEGGICGCGTGRLRCNQECVDPKTDLRHCGGCDRLCPRGQRCDAGLCVDSCAAEQTRCGEFCYDLKTNPLHCSACDQPCSPSEYCNDGTCQPTNCPKGESRCSGQCVNLQKDSKNCGACSQACPLKHVCLQGTCYLPPVVETVGGQPPWRDGPVETARFHEPRGMAFDAKGNMLVADRENHRLRKIDPRGNVTTIAGTGVAGFADGPGSQAQFDQPSMLAFDAAGNLYISDRGNNRIRKMDKAGKVTTFAGNGSSGFADGPGNQARFDAPQGLVFDDKGFLYVADRDNERIRKIDPQGNVTTFAGNGSSGFVDGPAAQARFRVPYGLAFSGGVLYVADTENHRIRKIDASGTVSTLAGSGSAGFLDGDAKTAKFNVPSGVAVDLNGFVIVADMANHRIRKIDPQGNVTTFSGTGDAGLSNGSPTTAQWNAPYGVVFDGKNAFYVSEIDNHTIRKLTMLGESSPFAGSPLSGFSEGPIFSARLSAPSGVVVDEAGNIFFTDEDNSQVRKIDLQGNVTTVAGSSSETGFANGQGSAALFNSPYGIALDGAGSLYVADRDNHQIRKIDPQGNVTTFAGSDAALPLSGLADGLGTQARFHDPYGVFYDPMSKLLYVADSGNHAIRTVDMQGNVKTVAGTARGYLDGPVAIAKFDTPTSLAIDPNGNIYIVDSGNDRIRKLDPQGNVTAFAGLDKKGFTNGPHLQAQFSNPFSIALGKDGFLYVTDADNHRIRKLSLDPKGQVETFAGNGDAGFNDGPALQSSLDEPAGIFIDSKGAVYFTERGNHLIRVIR